MHFLNGRFGGKYGDLTCTANNGQSVIDNFIVSSDIFNHIDDFSVGDPDLSDHFPINCKLRLFKEFVGELNKDLNVESVLTRHEYYKWQESLKQTFLDEFLEKFTRFYENITDENVQVIHSYFVNLYNRYENA